MISRAALLALFLTAAVQHVGGLRILASQFAGHADESAGGVAMHKYPTRITLRGKRIVVYPVAVYTTRVKKFKYKVLRLSYPTSKRSVYVHVVDECSQTSLDCRRNFKRARNQGRELVDLHWSVWKPLNLKKYGLHTMRGKVVGTLPRQKIKHVLTYDGKQGWVPKLWK